MSHFPSARFSLWPLALLGCAIGAAPANATETENLGIRILPAPGPLTVDGKVDDWDLSGGIFACGNVEGGRDKYALWFHAMYDADNLYLLARVADQTPLNNPGDTKLDFGWNGDSLQVRVVTGYGTPEEQKGVLNAWKGRDGRDVVEFDSPPRTKNSPKGEDIKGQGAQQAFTVQEGAGYIQEIAMPWRMLTKSGTAPKAGDTIVLTIEPNFTLGANSRLSIKDIFRAGVTIDRVFTFQAARIWGEARLMPAGRVEPQPARLSDGRQFPVTMAEGRPAVNWAGLVKTKERPGIVPIRFNLPAAGNVSLVIKNESGEIVRQLLTAEARSAGDNVVLWDGLTTPVWKTPGQPVPAGKYTWSALYNSGIGLKYRGVASNAGRVPWDNGPGTNWGGDMGNPSAVATEGDRVLLGWGASEAGKAAVLCNLQGKTLWNHKRGGFGGAAQVALDGGVAFIADGGVIYKLKASDATVASWTESGAAERTFRELVGGDARVPQVPVGMVARNGRLYLSSKSYDFSREDIKDWHALLAGASLPVTGGPANAMWNALPAGTQTRVTNWLANAASIPDDLRANGNAPDVRDEVVSALNKLLEGNALLGNKKLAGVALREANRRELEAQNPALLQRDTGFVAVVDSTTGQLLKKVPLPGAGALAAATGGVFVAVDGSSLVFVDAQNGTVKPVLRNLPSVQGLALDGTGNLYVSSGTDNQVLVYGPNGKLLRRIGRKGGRAIAGPWQADGLLAVTGIAVDRTGTLWAAENTAVPRRFSRWNAANGQLVAELFGPTHYGASGGTILPSDPNIMVGEGCEWQLEPATGLARCTAVIAPEFHAFARFVKGGNGRTYFAGVGPSYIGAGFGIPNIKIYERLGLGRYVLRASIYSYEKSAAGAAHTDFWADASGDSAVQATEVQTLPDSSRLGGYYMWSMFMNADLSLNLVSGTGKGTVLIKTSGFTSAGAPVYDLAGAKILNITGNGGLPSLDNRLLLVDITDEGRQYYSLYDVEAGKYRWRYLNGWFGVHGSHDAPAPEPGLIRGAFGIVGNARLPEPIGDLWAINTNVGEWHLLTRDGYYLSRLFQGDQMKVQFPAAATPGADMTEAPCGLGGEDFGGSLVQGDDGKLYVQAGKTGLWNLEVTGLESVRALPAGEVVLTEKETKAAAALRETLLQEAAGIRLAEVKRLTPTFSGDINRDFAGSRPLEYQKSADTAVRTVLAYDDANLYLGYDVKDPTPWLNSADVPESMYARGDTVDLQLGIDPKADAKRRVPAAGDLRLSIGQVGGKPVAIIYRKVATRPEDRQPHTFASGVVREYVMESVKVIPDGVAKIFVKVDAAGKRYSLEAAIPLATLGLTITPGLTLQGDVGVTHSNPAGDDTRLRTYWSDQQTGLVDDEVYELLMQPANWGQFKF